LSSPDSVPRRPFRGRAGRYLAALGIVATATLIRVAADSPLHAQLPYMFYMAAVVVATRLCGVDAGLFSIVASAFAANYFFVVPRHQFIPHPDDWVAMSTFSAVAFSVAWFVGRSRRAEREIRELHAQTSAVLEQMSAATLAAEVGVWTWLPETNRVSVGANWRALFGAAADAEVTFETWVAALHPDDRERAVATLNAAWRDRHQFASEYRVVRPDGTVRWIIDRGRAFHHAGGRVAGMAGINVDITKRKVAEEALRDADRTKDEFLATLSHELRTPLNAIVGWSDMLRRGALPPERVGLAADSIYRNATVQNELINDVLDVSRIVSGKVRIETRPIDPAALVEAAVESVRPAADAKGVMIAMELGAIPFSVAGDGTRLQQVFWNLVSNGVKFTPSGGRVRVSLRSTDDQVEIQVADTGVGISADFLPHVFERFRQHDSSTTRRHGGLGLGLAIVRHLVELHGGTVAAESAGEERGATFTVMLPGRRFEDRRGSGSPGVRRRSTRAVDPVRNDAPSLCGVRVLVVDDEADAREVAASVLRYHGATVTVAANAAEALEAFDTCDADVLLVDLAMPGEDGYALLGRIRAGSNRKGSSVPAIALTACARAEDQRRVLASGFQRHLAKPADSRALVRAVADVQSGKRDVA